MRGGLGGEWGAGGRAGGRIQTSLAAAGEAAAAAASARSARCRWCRSGSSLLVGRLAEGCGGRRPGRRLPLGHPPLRPGWRRLPGGSRGPGGGSEVTLLPSFHNNSPAAALWTANSTGKVHVFFKNT